MLLFHETQHFGWLMNCIAILALFVIYKVISSKRAFMFGPKPTVLIKTLSAIFLVCIFIIVQTIKLETIYYSDKITYQFNSIFAATPDVVYRDSIKSVQIVKSDSRHWGTNTDENNQVYNAAGSYRLCITLLNGKTIQLGTQQPDGLLRHLQGYYQVIE